SNTVVQGHLRGARFLIIDVDEWRGPAQKLIPGTDASKLPLLVRVDRQGAAMAQAHGSKLGLLDGETTGANLARVMAGGEIIPPAYQQDKDRRRSLAVADSRRQKELVKDRVPFQLEVVSREKLPDGGERLRVNLTINNNEAPRRYWTLPSHAPLPKEAVDVPRLSISRFEEHIRAGYFTYHTDPPISVIAAGNWGTIELKGYTLDVPEGTQQVAVHKLKQITVGGERATFAKKVPYELKITDASSLGQGRSFDNPGALVLEIAESFSAKVTP
ncbi:MAG: hypothetical protein VX938_11740, partial [Myxococcota bacterium]|nr:hypothetical protein [Myxococcota bacterium]